VHQDVFTNFSVFGFTEGVGELAEAVPGDEKGLEVLLRILDAFLVIVRGI
jgi:hypothetical protein